MTIVGIEKIECAKLNISRQSTEHLQHETSFWDFQLGFQLVCLQ